MGSPPVNVDSKIKHHEKCKFDDGIAAFRHRAWPVNPGRHRKVERRMPWPVAFGFQAREPALAHRKD
jgi:hypothetical protein